MMQNYQITSPRSKKLGLNNKRKVTSKLGLSVDDKYCHSVSIKLLVGHKKPSQIQSQIVKDSDNSFSRSKSLNGKKPPQIQLVGVHMFNKKTAPEELKESKSEIFKQNEKSMEYYKE